MLSRPPTKRVRLVRSPEGNAVDMAAVRQYLSLEKRGEKLNFRFRSYGGRYSQNSTMIKKTEKKSSLEVSSTNNNNSLHARSSILYCSIELEDLSQPYGSNGLLRS